MFLVIWRSRSDDVSLALQVNTACYIVDPEDHTKRVTEVDTPGEMVFTRPAFACMCMGYHDNPKDTARKFVPDPFGDGIMYKTGDVAQWIEAPPEAFGPALCSGPRPAVGGLADGFLPSETSHCRCTRLGTQVVGLLEVLGRNDDQLKIRGQMVNMVEIDTKATALPFVSLAGCRSVTTPSDETQVALYVVLPDESTLPEVRAELSKVLESFAVPMFINTIDEIPYNANGKLTRRQLPVPPMEAAGAGERECDDPGVEAQVLAILSARLGAVSLADNFFVLGGHSLLAVETVTAIRKNRHLGVRISVGEIFAHADVAALVQLVEARKLEGSGAEDASIPRRGEVSLMVATGRGFSRPDARDLTMFPLQASHAAIPVPAATPRVSCMVRGPAMVAAYQTVSLGVWLEGELDKDALRQSLGRVLERHESLRSHFTLGDGGQRFLCATDAADFPLPLQEQDYSELAEPAAVKRANEIYEQDACFEPFDIFRAAPFDDAKRGESDGRDRVMSLAV
jgi:hypothetical protein